MPSTASERRIIAVLVADIVGSTAIGERLGPERSKFLFDEIARLMAAQVRRFGGTVAQLTGDGVLALFGAPAAHDDDSERAVRAALAIHEALGGYAREVEDAYGVALAARVGVNTGPVVAPGGDEPADVLYNALGDTVNVAARLQSLAGEGGVAVGAMTAWQVEGGFELEPLGEVELKGKSERVEAFRVTGERETPAAATGLLVGRSAEVAVLDAVFDELIEGRGAIVSVVGEPGIGKSRLVSETRARFADRVRFFEGHAVAYAEVIPYWPIRDLLRGWLGLGVDDHEARARLELKARLAQVGSEQAYSFLANLLGLTLEPDSAQRLGELSPDSVQRQTFEAVRELILTLAREQPLCLVLDDLHWADETTLELLEELLPTAEEEQVALILLYRNEREHGSWRLGEQARRVYPHRFTELELSPLDPDATRELTESIAGTELSAELEAAVAERTGGNPFFVEEAVRDLLERGALEPDADLVTVPARVQETLQARLGRLTPATHELVGVASVIGRTFGLPLLERAAPSSDLGPALSELQRLDLIVEERRRPVAEYRFRHGLVQEVAYASLLEQKRRDLHATVGRALEDSPDEVIGLLAHHFSQAHDPEKAAEYLLRAGDAARALYANQEADGHYRRALAFLDELGDQRCARDTLLKIALTHHLAFDFKQAATTYADAFARPPSHERSLQPTEQLSTALDTPVEIVPGYAYAEAGTIIAQSLFRGLLSVDRDLNVIPSLAESFRLSSDGLAYRFQLRADARWSDGVPVTADDFAFTWQQMRDENVSTAFMLDYIETAEALDARTLEVRLREPRNYFPYILTQPSSFAWPRHVVERLGPDWRRPENLVGSGPFILAEFTGEHARLQASPRWALPRGNVRDVHISFIGSNEVTASWRHGRFDVVELTSPEEQLRDTIVAPMTKMATGWLGFRADLPPFDDELLRKAFAHAIDRHRLNAAGTAYESARLESSGRGGLVPPSMPGHSHQVALEYDLERARSLLAEAGYPGGLGLPKIDLVVGSMSTEWVAALQDQLGEVFGTAVRARTASAGEVEEFLNEGSPGHAFVSGWIADHPDPSGVIDTMFSAHPLLYRDDEIVGLLGRAQGSQDQHERLSLYREVEQLWIAERAAFVPLSYFRAAILHRPWVEGFWANPTHWGPFDEVVIKR